MSITSIVTYDADIAYRRERAMDAFTRVGRRGWRARLAALDPTALSPTPAASPTGRATGAPCPAARVPSQRPA